MTENEVMHLRSFPSDQSRLEHFQEDLEELYFEQHPDLKAESDKSWDALHRALTDGELSWDGGKYPFSHVVLGGESLYSENDYIMSLKTPPQVLDIAAAVPLIGEAELRRGYFAIDPDRYGFPLSDEDFEYTWNWFQDVRDLYDRAAKLRRYVLFTASQ